MTHLRCWSTIQRAISQEYPRKWLPVLGLIWLAAWLLYTFLWHNPEGFVIFGLVQVVWVFTRISLRYRKVRRHP